MQPRSYSAKLYKNSNIKVFFKFYLKSPKNPKKIEQSQKVKEKLKYEIKSQKTTQIIGFVLCFGNKKLSESDIGISFESTWYSYTL